MEQNLHRVLAEKLQLGSMEGMQERLDLTMNGLEEKATMWNLCGGSGANKTIMDALAGGKICVGFLEWGGVWLIGLGWRLSWIDLRMMLRL